MMFKSVLSYFILITLFWGCYQQPDSRRQIMNPEDDQLSNERKIALIKGQADVLLHTSLAAIANIYDELNNWPQAIEAIDDAIRQDPMNSSYHNMKAKYAFRLGQKSIAYREALTAYQLGSKSLQQSLDLAKIAAALSEFSIVGNIIDSLVLIYPDDPDVIYVAARKYDIEGNKRLARKNYQKVNDMRPEDLDNTLYFVRFLISAGDLTAAKNIVMKDTLQHQVRQIDLLRGEIYLGMNNYDSAALHYRLALTKQEDTTIYNAVIHAYKMANNLDSIISIARHASNTYPENKFYLHTAAIGLDKKYLYNESLVYYLTLYKLDTLDTLVEQELAYLKRKIAYLQRRGEAQKKLDDSLKAVLLN